VTYFTDDELKCSCCGKNEMHPEFMQKLNKLREEFNEPMIVTSAYRCPSHPIEAAKDGDTPGPHTTGKAIDIAISHYPAYRLFMLAIQHDFTGIGVSQKGDSRFLHLDTLTHPTHYRPTIWSY